MTTLPAQSKWIIEKILPVRRVHILAGPSGSGKTTYLFQHLPQWEKGQPIHNHASFPVPWLYISCDRPREEMDETFERVGIDPASVRSMCLMDEEHKHLETVEMLFQHVIKNYPTVRLLVIDAFYVLTPEGKYNDNAKVRKFLTNLSMHCKKYNITVLGTAHSPKMKEGESYLSPRECILGAIAWGAFSSTVLYIKPVQPEDPTNDERNLVIIPRNGKAETYDYLLDDEGKLIAAPPKRKENPAANLREFIAALPLGEEFDTGEAVFASGASRQYTGTLIREFLKEGIIKLQRRGLYTRIQSSSEAFFSPSQQLQ